MRLQDKLFKVIQKDMKDVNNITLQFTTYKDKHEYVECFVWTEGVSIIANATVSDTEGMTYNKVAEELLKRLRIDYKVRNETTKSIT